MRNPVRGMLHGSAALVSLGSVALVVEADGPSMTWASAIYGLTLVGMYTISALYHSVPWSGIWEARMQRLDHVAIYSLVAATFTVLAVGAGGGPWAGVGIAAIWGLVGLGLAQEFSSESFRPLLLRFQVVAVAAVLPALGSALVRMDASAAVLTVVGGVTYLLGTLLFVNDRPRLAPRVFSHHEFFHVVVVISSLLHFSAVWWVA